MIKRNSKGQFIKGSRPINGFKKGQKEYLKRKKTPEYMKKLSDAGKKWHKTHIDGFKGKHHSKETIQILRKKSVLYMKEHRGYQKPNVGKHEKEILDYLETSGIKIIRQYPVLGYWIDGYIPEYKLAIEIDERVKNKPKDIGREDLIKDELGCIFIRISTKDFAMTDIKESKEKEVLNGSK